MMRWVPRCPACGFDMATALSVPGTDATPAGAEAYNGRQVHCPACGHSVVLKHNTEWVRVA